MDLIILSVPGETSYALPAAPAILKSYVIDAGYTCKTFDFNILFKKTNISNFSNLENYFIQGFNPELIEQAENLIEGWVKEIIKYKPKFIGISVFTYQNRNATEIFCKFLKKYSDSKIILGGQGISDGGIEGKKVWVNSLYNRGLIDYWIVSEGEKAIVELLSGNTDYTGINGDNFLQNIDLDNALMPNYDDYNLLSYRNRLPITGSRGCVRQCTFCDIHEHWKYVYRSGKSIADEIIYLSQKHNIQTFSFTDSLVNGSIKEFKKFIKIIADYNLTADKPIQWTGQYIVRRDTNNDLEYWKLLKDSGASWLAIGVETGSDTVRLHMKKKFTNADLDVTIQRLLEFNIACEILLIVGYPTETEKDFQDTLEMFNRYLPFKSIIQNIAAGSSLGVLPNTFLYNKSDLLNLILDEKNENNWLNKDNPTLTLRERLNRIKILTEHCKNLGYTIRDNNNIIFLEKNLNLLEKRMKFLKIKSNFIEQG